MGVKLSIDSSVNAGYIEITEGDVATTVQAMPAVLVDLDEHGGVVGLEILNINAQLPIGELASRFDLAQDAVDALWQLSAGAGFRFGHFTQSSDGTSSRRAVPQVA